MQSLLTVLLICALAAAVAWLGAVAFRRHRRAAALAQKAYRLNMRFSATDPFDIPRRFGGFAVISSGHSPSACNVAHGGIGGCPVRAFDFRYESGHGTRRETRHYGVIAIETPAPLPEVLMWPEQDARCAPPAVRWRRERIGAWSFCGDEAFARALARGCRDIAHRGPGIQTRGPVLLLSLPARRATADYTDELGRIGPLLRELKGASAPQNARRPEAPTCNPAARTVENRPET